MVNNKSWGIVINKLSDFEIKEGLTSFVNPYSMLVLKENENVAQGVDYWYVDGISLVKLVNWLFSSKISRFSFDDTSVAPIVFANAAAKNQRLAIIGSEPDVIGKSVKFIENKYNTQVIYYRDGYMRNEDEVQQTIKTVIDKKIEVIVCGMGTPKQEEFLIKLKQAGWGGYGYTCGGYLHQIAKKNKDYYPVIVDRLHIRWVYRILDEPKLLSRYFIKYPQFLNQLLVFRINQKKI